MLNIFCSHLVWKFHFYQGIQNSRKMKIFLRRSSNVFRFRTMKEFLPGKMFSVCLVANFQSGCSCWNTTLRGVCWHSQNNKRKKSQKSLSEMKLGGVKKKIVPQDIYISGLSDQNDSFLLDIWPTKVRIT